MATSTDSTGTGTGHSNLPRPSKSRLPVYLPRSGSRLATTRDQPSAAASPSRPAASPSTPRVLKSPAARPRTITSNAKPPKFSSDRGPSSDRPRTHSITKSPSRLRLKEPEPASPAKVTPAISMKEAIALKRAEAKKTTAAKSSSQHGGMSGFEDMLPTSVHAADEDDLGRLSLRETIERARSSGHTPKFHLSITPEKLSSVPDEPPLPEKLGKKSRSNTTTWYDQQDLSFLRARNNQIMELQPEISLFGSLKTIDFQNNRLTSLPDSFADLTSLINLDLSHNSLISLPPHFFSLPSLSVLDLSHNSLTALPFNMPFDPTTTVPAPRRPSGFFSPSEIVRATRPLPCLTSLDASHNKITSSAIHHDTLPQDLKTFSLMYNPLGNVAELLTSLSPLTQLLALRLSRCDIDDASFPATLLSSANRPTFPKLAVLDLEETRATQAAVSSALSGLAQSIDFEASVTDERAVPAGILAVAVGKRIVREAWEVEADRHVQRLRERRSAANLKDNPVSESPPPPPPLPHPIQKEQWEIDAEQGLLSEGAQRRARAEAAAQRVAEDPGAVVGPTATTATSHSTPVLGRYWDPHMLTFTLPPSTAVRHGADAAGEEESLPRVTLPLALIVTQPFADTLHTLELRGRRAEPGIVLPTPSDGSQHLLPRLETLNLEGCALSDVVPGAEFADADGTLGVLARLFPSLRNLELAYNNFTGAALGRGVLEQLLFVGDGDNGRRVGLRRLALCGNKIEELHGLRELAQVVFGAGADVANTNAAGLSGKWTLEELDVRENSIAVLPRELGLLPLDSFLVDGNLFRVPPRRVWEREGTKGLLMWLRGRLEVQ